MMTSIRKILRILWGSPFPIWISIFVSVAVGISISLSLAVISRYSQNLFLMLGGLYVGIMLGTLAGLYLGHTHRAKMWENFDRLNRSFASLVDFLGNVAITRIPPEIKKAMEDAQREHEAQERKKIN